MKIRAFLAAFGCFAFAALFAASPAFAAPPDLTARPAAYATDWPPGVDLLVPASPAVVLRAVRDDGSNPAEFRSLGPVSRSAHLFTASGRFTAAVRTARPAPS